MKTIGHVDHGNSTLSLVLGASQERKVYYSYLTPEEQIALPARITELEREVADLKLQLEKPARIREELRVALENWHHVYTKPDPIAVSAEDDVPFRDYEIELGKALEVLEKAWVAVRGGEA